MRISGSWWGSGAIGEVRPGHRDGVETVEVAEGTISITTRATMHVELAARSSEAVAISGRRGDAGGCVGEVRPGHGDGVKGVKVAEGTTRASITTRAAMHVELAPRRREAVFKSGRRGDAGGCVGEVRPDLRDGVEGVEIAQQIVIRLIFAPVNV